MRYFALFVASLMISLIMLVSSHLLKSPFDPDIVIVGAIMPFVPGVALTNAVRGNHGRKLHFRTGADY